MTFWIVQIIGLVSLILSLFSVQQRKKENFLNINSLSQILDLSQYILTNSLTGAISTIIAFVRVRVYYLYKKRGLKPSLAVLIVFFLTAIITTVLSWKNFLSILPFIAVSVNTWGMWQDDMRRTRVVLLIGAIAWTAYDLSARMYTAAISDILFIVSTAVSIWRLDIRKSNKEENILNS